jgi:hypothetical protein
MNDEWKADGFSFIIHHSSLIIEFEDGGGDGAQLFVAELRVEGEREDFAREGFGRGERGLAAAAEERLEVERGGVVNQRLDAARGEVCAQALALRVAHDVEVEDVRAGARARRREYEAAGAARQQAAVL